MKKIKITLKNPSFNISEILNLLNISINDIEFIVNVEENKDTYKKLSTSDLIDDWDFIESQEKVGKPITEKKTCSCPDIDNNYASEGEELAIKVINTFNVVSENELATFVEAVWRTSRISPNILFGSNLFITAVKQTYDEVASSDLTLEHSLLSMIISNYYSGHDFNTILNDTLLKLKVNWKTLSSQSSLAGVSKLLYEKL